MLKSFQNRAVAAFLGWALFVIIVMVSCNVHAQAVTTWTGKVMPVTQHAGADITIAPLDRSLKLYGWLQVKYTVYPVYVGSRNGLFIVRKAATTGTIRHEYVTDQVANIIKE